MKKLFYCLLLVAAGQSEATLACNACGCSASNQYMGLLPQTSTNFVGFQYLYRSFSTLHTEEMGSVLPGTSYENYQTMQVWGRVNISKAFQAMAFVPYTINTQHQEGAPSSTIAGMGDASVVFNYKALNRDNCAWHQKLIAGAGIKLPTGKYDSKSVSTKEGLPNMQPGTHSWDVLGSVNYTIRHRTIGANIDASYTATTANKESYKFGNRMSIGALAFYQLEKRKFMIIPQAGVRYDRAAKDYTNYAIGIMDDDGGGWQLYALQGVQAYYKKLGLQLTCYEPISQHYVSGLVNTRFRIETGVIIVLN